MARREKQPKKDCVLYTLTYDANTAEYTCKKEKITRSDIPREAVHVTNEKNAYLLDMITPETDPDPTGISAIDLRLYMVNYDINDSLAVLWKAPHEYDIRKILTYLIIGIIGICVIYPMIV